jgi:glycerol dehydrogenase-like iron-containing ADH family enzyme
MKLKSLLYEKEQTEIINEIISILDMEGNTITLYELDNDSDKTQKIVDLIPTIRKYYAFNNIKAVAEPEKIKRPWLSIIKQLCKEKYTISRKDHRIYQEYGTVIRTILYTFQDK